MGLEPYQLEQSRLLELVSLLACIPSHPQSITKRQPWRAKRLVAGLQARRHLEEVPERRSGFTAFLEPVGSFSLRKKSCLCYHGIPLPVCAFFLLLLWSAFGLMGFGFRAVYSIMLEGFRFIRGVTGACQRGSPFYECKALELQSGFHGVEARGFEQAF